MKISHVSVEVREPERAARALAEIWDGSAHPFSPLPGACIAFSSEEPSSQVEFYPDRTELEPIDTRDECDPLGRGRGAALGKRLSLVLDVDRPPGAGLAVYGPGRLPRPCRKGC